MWTLFVSKKILDFFINKKEDLKKKIKMLVNEDDVMNIMGGMEHAGGIKLNDHKRKLKNR